MPIPHADEVIDACVADWDRDGSAGEAELSAFNPGVLIAPSQYRELAARSFNAGIAFASRYLAHVVRDPQTAADVAALAVSNSEDTR